MKCLTLQERSDNLSCSNLKLRNYLALTKQENESEYSHSDNAKWVLLTLNLQHQHVF